jgi:hypothetical protein
MSYSSPYERRKLTETEYIAAHERDCTDPIREYADARHETELIAALIDIFNQARALEREGDTDEKLFFSRIVARKCQTFIDDWAGEREGWGYD